MVDLFLSQEDSLAWSSWNISTQLAKFLLVGCLLQLQRRIGQAGECQLIHLKPDIHLGRVPADFRSLLRDEIHCRLAEHLGTDCRLHKLRLHIFSDLRLQIKLPFLRVAGRCRVRRLLALLGTLRRS